MSHKITHAFSLLKAKLETYSAHIVPRFSEPIKGAAGRQFTHTLK